jgi:hypothetical protein
MTINKSASILGNTSPEILKPVKTNLGLFQIKWIEELNTHVLLLDRGRGAGDILVATQYNGHSLHALAKCVLAGNQDRIASQLNYIRQCGGTVAAEHFFLES